MIFEKMIFNLVVKVHIVHSLPGRLRINIPYAKKIPKEWQLENSYFDVLRRIKGINDIQFCYVTANALILYDANKTNPDEIIKIFYELAKLANQHTKELSSFDANNKEAATQYFTTLLEAHFDLIKP